MHWQRNSNKPTRNTVLFIFLVGLPILAYIVAAFGSVFIDLNSESEILMRSIAPFFDKYYAAIVEKLGSQPGNRFLMTSFTLIISFLAQLIFVLVLAVDDHRKKRFPSDGFSPAVIFACAAVIALFVFIFFFPDYYLNTETRSARALLSTDLKYFFIASLFGSSSITFYVFLRLICSFVKPR